MNQENNLFPTVTYFLLAICFTYFSVLGMQTVRSPETSVNLYRNTPRQIVSGSTQKHIGLYSDFRLSWGSIIVHSYLDFYTVWTRAVLSTFCKYILPPSSGSELLILYFFLVRDSKQRMFCLNKFYVRFSNPHICCCLCLSHKNVRTLITFTLKMEVAYTSELQQQCPHIHGEKTQDQNRK
jgi:hypothetical protein